jgi:hypothetical protein
LNFYLAAPEAGRQGIFKIIAAAPKDANPPAFVPADAVKFWRWRVDGQKSWAALEKMLSDISPAWLGSLNSAISIANATAPAKRPELRPPQKPHRQPGRRLDQLSKSAGGQIARGFEFRPLAFPVCRPTRSGRAGDQKRRLAHLLAGKRARAA